MEYRNMGRSGLKVSTLSLGTATFGDGVDVKLAREMMAAAFDAGVNYYDTAEVYGGSRSEQVLGAALKELKWPRMKYVLATKFSIGLGTGPNESGTLNRKYLHHAIDGSLQRLGLGHVDIIYCHWPDPTTPIEETIYALHTLIERGKALYWATSNWRAEQVRAAVDLAERHHLHKPIVDQMEYNMLYRSRAEHEFARVTAETGVGIAAYSPLAGGVLSGKYRQGVPSGSRATQAGLEAYSKGLVDAQRNVIVGELEKLAQELGCTVAQLALAWCLIYRPVATVVLGATRLEQVTGNLGAVNVLPRLTPPVVQRIEHILGDYDQSWMPLRAERPTT